MNKISSAAGHAVKIPSLQGSNMTIPKNKILFFPENIALEQACQTRGLWVACLVYWARVSL